MAQGAQSQPGNIGMSNVMAHLDLSIVVSSTERAELGQASLLGAGADFGGIRLEEKE